MVKLLTTLRLRLLYFSCRLHDEILQKEEAENNLAAFRAVSPRVLQSVLYVTTAHVYMTLMVYILLFLCQKCQE